MTEQKTQTEEEVKEMSETEIENLSSTIENLSEDIAVSPPIIKNVNIGGDKSKDPDEFEPVFIINGKKESVSVPLPDDLSDESEPLVRLSELQNFDLPNLAKMDNLTVYTKDGEHFSVCYPPKKEGMRGKLLYKFPQLFNYELAEERYKDTITIRFRPIIRYTFILSVYFISALLFLSIHPITVSDITFAPFAGMPLIKLISSIFSLLYAVDQTEKEYNYNSAGREKIK